MLEITVIFREINKIAQFFDLSCVPTYGGEHDRNYLSILDYGTERPWRYYMQFRVHDGFIKSTVIMDNKVSNNVRHNSVSTVESTSLGDPQCFDKIGKILEDWKRRENVE